MTNATVAERARDWVELEYKGVTLTVSGIWYDKRREFDIFAVYAGSSGAQDNFDSMVDVYQILTDEQQVELQWQLREYYESWGE